MDLLNAIKNLDFTFVTDILYKEEHPDEDETLIDESEKENLATTTQQDSGAPPALLPPKTQLNKSQEKYSQDAQTAHLPERSQDQAKEQTSFEEKQILPVHAAAQTGSVKMLQLLLTHGMNVNETDENGTTPLEIAVRYEHFDAAKFLIENGAKVEKNGKNIFTSSRIFVGNQYLKLKSLFAKPQEKPKKTEPENVSNPDESKNKEKGEVLDLIQEETSPTNKAEVVVECNSDPEEKCTPRIDETSVVESDAFPHNQGNMAANTDAISPRSDMEISPRPPHIENENNLANNENTDTEPHRRFSAPIKHSSPSNGILKPRSMSTSSDENGHVKKRVTYSDEVVEDPDILEKRRHALYLDAEKKRNLITRRRISSQRKHSVGKTFR